VGVALVGQYRATFFVLRPGYDQKLPALTARRNVDTGKPTVQCRYSMRFLIDGKSYAFWWFQWIAVVDFYKWSEL
jgi:hypothetical protein